MSGLAGFGAAFGSLGLKVGPRTGAGKRSQADTEWFVVRRFLEVALGSGIFVAPFSIERTAPPAPDFTVRFGSGDIVAFVEITEATHPDDQREMTEFERSNQSAMLIGDYGGRFADGASQPGWVWASDIVDALERKNGKAIYTPSDKRRHLVIYPNSNASALLFDRNAERVAFGLLLEAVASRQNDYVKLVNGCSVHVLGKDHVCFDILGNVKLVRRG